MGFAANLDTREGLYIIDEICMTCYGGFNWTYSLFRVQTYDTSFRQKEGDFMRFACTLRTSQQLCRFF